MLQTERFRLDIRKKIFPLRLVRQVGGGRWNRLPIEIVAAQGLAGWGFEQPGLMEDVPAHERKVGSR